MTLSSPPPASAHPAHDVHLPELHRPRALPAAVVGGAAAAALRVDQAVAHQGPVDRRAAGRRGGVLAGQVVADRARAPAGVVRAHLDDAGLEAGSHLVRAAARPAGVVGEPGDARLGVAPQPAVHRLARDAIASRDLAYLHTAQHLEHRLVTLFHPAKICQHDPALPRPLDRLEVGSSRNGGRHSGTDTCNTGTEAPVARVPEPRPEVSHGYRSRCVT